MCLSRMGMIRIKTHPINMIKHSKIQKQTNNQTSPKSHNATHYQVRTQYKNHNRVQIHHHRNN